MSRQTAGTLEADSKPSGPAAALEPEILTALARIDHSNLKVRLILAAAKTLFFNNAYDAVSMESVASLAGISKGTLYLHFKNKEVLFAALIVAELATITDDVWHQTGEIADVEAVLRRVAQNYHRLFGSSHAIDVYRSLISVSAKFPALGRLFYDRGTRILVERLAAYLAARSAEGALNARDPELAAQQFLSLVRGNLHLREVLSAEPPSAAEITKVIEAGVALFLAGYRGRTPSRP